MSTLRLVLLFLHLLGWAAQVAAVSLGVLTPWMYAMGIIFALIWIMSFVLGKRLDARPRNDQV